MSRTLNLVDGLLLRGRARQQFGRVQDAFSIFSRLTGFRELPRDVAEEAQQRLGEIELGRKRYRRACRHLAAALRFDPDNARTHRLLASALRARGEGHWDDAARHYRRALELDPEQADCLAEAGLLACRTGHAEEGLRQLREAVGLEPDRPELLTQLVRGLRLAGRWDEARRELRAALFRHPRDRRFRRLWDDFQFQQLRREQRAARRPVKGAADDGPVLLPFTPAPKAAGKGEPKILRKEGPAPAPRGGRGASALD
jgi:tetratricopeptide (TPR) repeat protein